MTEEQRQTGCTVRKKGGNYEKKRIKIALNSHVISYEKKLLYTFVCGVKEISNSVRREQDSKESQFNFNFQVLFVLFNI